MEFPTRNYARFLLNQVIEKRKISKGSGLISRQEKEDLISHVIAWHEKMLNNTDSEISSKFIGAAVDIFPDIKRESFNSIKYFTATPQNTNDIDLYFKAKIGQTIQEILAQSKNRALEYKISMNETISTSLDLRWFNNCQTFIPPLLGSYKSYKIHKDISCEFEDIEQIIIDYSLSLCYNHLKQAGFLNKKICLSIIDQLIEVVDNRIVYAFVGNFANYRLPNRNSIQNIVLKDIQNPICIEAAYNFLKEL